MPHDPLASFRTKEPARSTAPASIDAAGKEAYQAFGSKDNQRKTRIDIRPADDLAHAVGYNYLIEIAYDRRNYTAVGLIFSTLIVKMRGRNLKPIIDAIRLGSCEYVAQFDARDHELPDDDTLPFVEHMEIVSASAARERQGKATS